MRKLPFRLFMHKYLVETPYRPAYHKCWTISLLHVMDKLTNSILTTTKNMRRHTATVLRAVYGCFTHKNFPQKCSCDMAQNSQYNKHAVPHILVSIKISQEKISIKVTTADRIKSSKIK